MEKNTSKKSRKLTPEECRGIGEGAMKHLRERAQERKRLGLREPESPGLTSEALNWRADY